MIMISIGLIYRFYGMLCFLTLLHPLLSVHHHPTVITLKTRTTIYNKTGAARSSCNEILLMSLMKLLPQNAALYLLTYLNSLR